MSQIPETTAPQQGFAFPAGEAFLHDIMENAAVGMVLLNTKGSWLYVNRAYASQLGYEPEDCIRLGARNLIHPDELALARDQLKDMAGGRSEGYTTERRYLHKSGAITWGQTSASMLRDDRTGEPIYIIIQVTDITGLKTAEAALAEEKERLRVTLQSIGDGVISTDESGRITFVNPVAEQMTGWSSAQAVGRRVEEVFALVDEASGEIMPDPITAALASSGLVHLNEAAVLVSRTSERRTVRDSAAPVRSPDGLVIGAVLVFQDITQSRALQKELAHSAFHDALTGLPNRKAFELALVDAIEQAQREGREHALCFVDLDRFKQVNDSAGHAAGDELLRQAGQTIRRSCRNHDFAGRIGGDEFAILLRDCSLTGGQKVAQQVIDAISSTHFIWKGHVHRIAASVGITAIDANSSSPAVMTGQADAACYAAKNAGRNQVALYDPTQPGPRQFAQIA